MYADLILRTRGKFADMLFTYEVPSHLLTDIKEGHRVSVPFGRSNKPIEAIVVSLKENISEDADISKIKEIDDILDESPLISSENIDLIKWMRNRYMCTYIDCLNLFYPKGYSLETRKIVEIGKIEDEFELEDEEMKLINTLRLSSSAATYEDLTKNFTKKLISDMQKKRLIKIIWEYKDKKNEKFIKYISLADTMENIEKLVKDKKYRLGSKQKELIKFLSLNESVEQDALMQLLELSRSTIKSLESKGIVKIEMVEYYRKSINKLAYKDKEISLNKEQKEIYESILDKINYNSRKVTLLHGVTGSGKTEIYLELIEYMLSQGMDSIFLVPEIALTPQMIARVRNRFGDIVGVFHSMLSEGEKHDVFREIKEGNVRVVIGTRSALFLPFTSLGLIVIDEEHEMSYRSEMTPKYDSIEVARYMAYKQGVTVLLASATPSISDYYRAEKGEYDLLTLNKRANNKPMPEIEVVDMREELHKGNKDDLSEKMIEEIQRTVESGNQAILFLNRRGFASFLTCKDCGHVFRCDRCDISLTYHKYKNKGVCHYCGKEEVIPDKCPECGNKNISPIGIGTEKIELYLKEKFPNYKILRVDKDTTSKKGQLEKILNSFNSGQADILIGTQILSKGHDFDNVTLVGIISADMMLNYPDYRAFESTFQLITQVSGRAGRSDKEGKVILQSYNTEHYAIQKAIDYDYKGFYQKEIAIRKTFGYEPFNNIFRLVFSGYKYNKVRENADRFLKTLEYLLKENNIYFSDLILGPNECSINKINDKYRWQVIVKDNNMNVKKLKSMIKYICVTKYEEIFDKDIVISIEQNPNSFI
ncbi:primosomal protein N' [Peptostreptococcus russellii]|uniref:primosomal protein N' n=1 Tax=Peptostreptococcus russellii TaxID=215200 RepID=UPI00162923AC|nr:primosomal protein N' [Peptostreptococcus russellii]